MNLRRYKFRILFSFVSIVFTVLPVVGVILTFGHGPNPFDFLVPLAMPAFYLLDALDRFLPVPKVYGLFVFLLGLPLNLLMYFLVGWLLDYIVNRHWAGRDL
jgi:hypothetical protein